MKSQALHTVWCSFGERVQQNENVYFCLSGSEILPDFFLDVEDVDMDSMMKQHIKMGGAGKGGHAPGSAGGVATLAQKIQSLCSEELVKSVNGVFQFDLEGDEAGAWYLDLKNGTGESDV